MGYKNAQRRTQAKEVNETVTDGLNELAADFYDEKIVKLVQGLDTCLNRNGDYVEK
jgi:hypothetical protein